MPFVGRSVEPVHIRRNVIRKTQVTLGGEHEALVNGSLAHVLRQIADLSVFVEGLFQELLEESATVVARSERLGQRVRALAEKAERLNVLDSPLPECGLLVAAEQGARRCSVAYRAAERLQECRLFTARSRPPCVCALYAGAAPAVRALPSADRRGGGGAGGSLLSAARRRSLLEPAVVGSLACWQQSLEPVVTKPGPTVVTLPAAKLPQRKTFRRTVGALRKPRCTVVRDPESATDVGHRDAALFGRARSALLPTALVAVDTSNEAFDRLVASRALSRNGARSHLKRRLTLSGSPAELAGLRSNMEASLRLTAAAGVASPLSRHLDLQPSAVVSPKNPDTYVDDGAPDSRQQRASRLQQSPIGRWLLQRSRSLPRDFGRRRRGGEAADVGGSFVDRSSRSGSGHLMPNGSAAALVDDRSHKVFVNFYGEPVSPGCPSANVPNGTTASASARKGKPPRLDGATLVKSRSHGELSRTSGSLRSKPNHRRSASAERPPRCRERPGPDVGESFLSHTLPCLFRRKTSSDEEAGGAPSAAGSASRRTASARGTLTCSRSSAATRSSRRAAASQLLANVTLRKRDSKATTMSTSSGRWSGSDRYSFGSDCNVSSASSHHKLCSSRVSVDHDSAVCMDGSSSRINSRLDGSSDLTVPSAGAAAAGPFRSTCTPHPVSFDGDGDNDDEDDSEPLFVLQADSEVLLLYSVDQDGFYTTMHSDSRLLEKGCSDDGDVSWAAVSSKRSASPLRHVRLCDGTAQTDVTFAGSEGADDTLTRAQRRQQQLLAAGDLRADAGPASPSAGSCASSSARSCPPGGPDCSGGSDGSECRARGVQLFHSLVPVTPDGSDDEQAAGDVLGCTAQQRTAVMVPTGAAESADVVCEPMGEQQQQELQLLLPWQPDECDRFPSPGGAAVAAAAMAGLQPPTTTSERVKVVPDERSPLPCAGGGGGGGGSPKAIADDCSTRPPLDTSLPASSLLRAGGGQKAKARPPPPQLPVRTSTLLRSDGVCEPCHSLLLLRGSAAAASDGPRLAAAASPSPPPATSGVGLIRSTDGVDLPSAAGSRTCASKSLSTIVASQLDDDDGGGVEIGAAEFPLMEADAEALSITTARCLSVLATQFKVKDGANPLLSAAGHWTASSNPAHGSALGGGDPSKPASGGSQVSSLIEQARRMSVYGGLLRSGSEDEEGGAGAPVSPAAAMQPAMSRSYCPPSRRSAPGHAVQSSIAVDGAAPPACHLLMRGSRSSGSLGEGKQQQQRYQALSSTASCRPETQQSCPSAGMPRTAAGVPTEAGREAASGSAATAAAYDVHALAASSGASRTVSYRIANGTLSYRTANGTQTPSDCDEVGELRPCTGRAAPLPLRGKAAAEVDRRESTPPAAAAASPPPTQPLQPPRALSYRVANDTEQLCLPLHATGCTPAGAAVSVSGGGRRLTSPGSRHHHHAAGVREFMKGIYENSEKHLPPLPAAPVTSELVCITKSVAHGGDARASRGSASGVSPSLPGCPSTFLPGDERSSATCLRAAGSSECAVMAEAAASSYPGWAELELPFSLVPGAETVVPRGHQQQQSRAQLPKERPRSSVMTKGDRRELEWMQNNFATLLQRCFNDDDAVYASLEALRQDESSLLSLIDSVQEHAFSAAPAALPAEAAAAGGSAAAATVCPPPPSRAARPASLASAAVLCTQTEV